MKGSVAAASQSVACGGTDNQWQCSHGAADSSYATGKVEQYHATGSLIIHLQNSLDPNCFSEKWKEHNVMEHWRMTTSVGVC